MFLNLSIEWESIFQRCLFWFGYDDVGYLSVFFSPSFFKNPYFIYFQFCLELNFKFFEALFLFFFGIWLPSLTQRIKSLSYWTRQQTHSKAKWEASKVALMIAEYPNCDTFISFSLSLAFSYCCDPKTGQNLRDLRSSILLSLSILSIYLSIYTTTNTVLA